MFSKLLAKPLYAIGLMSGTSLDGVDVAIIEITNQRGKDEYLLKYFNTYSYSKELKQKILENSSPKTSNVQSICSLNVEIGSVYVKSIKKALKEAKMVIDEIAFISSHGQTIWHNPKEMDHHASSTLQIGDANLIAYAFNKTVVYDFRPMDMAAGGEGAPLIPFIDNLLFKEKYDGAVLTNIGGIANLTYLGKKIIAMDTGPGNMLIDGAMRLLYQLPFDQDGMIASQGNVIKLLLDELMSDEYFLKPAPKSTGREKYNDLFLKEVIKKAKAFNAANSDIITTLTHLTVYSIIEACHNFLPPIKLMIIAGGGSQNKYMISLFKKIAPFEIKISDEIGLSSAAKEAMGFAILGYYRLKGLPANLPSATGANESVCLGSIILPPKGVDFND